MKLILSAVLVIIVMCIASCSSFEVNYNEYCPEGYSRIVGETICILITTKSLPYASECIKSGSNSTVYYQQLIDGNSPVIINYLLHNNITEVWLPIRKNTDGIFFWDLAGPVVQNGKITEFNSIYVPNNASDDCIVFYTNSHEIVLDDCHYSYQLMCLFDTSESLLVPSALCDNRYIGRLSKFHDLCFKITDYGVGNPVKINSNDTFVVIDKLIGVLEMTHESLLVYDVLSSSTSQPSVFQQGAMKNIKPVVHMKQVVFEVYDISKIPIIDIEYNATSSQLTVIVTNYKFLWNSIGMNEPFWCNNEKDITVDAKIKSNYDLIHKTEISIGFRTELPADDIGISTIWCEGQLLKTFEPVRSNRLIVERYTNNLNSIICAELKQKCYSTPCNIFEEFEHQHNMAGQVIKDYSDFEIKEIQIKKIVSLDQINISFLLHFILEFYSDDVDNKLISFKTDFTDIEQYEGLIMDTVRLNNICDSINNYFPSAKLNEQVLSKELCYNTNGTLPTQECVGNLIEGSYWKEIVNTSIFNECNTAFKNDVTTKLFTVTKDIEGLSNATPPKEKIAELVGSAIKLMNLTLKKADNIKDMHLVSTTLYHFAKITRTNIFDLQIDELSNEEGLPGAIIYPITRMFDTILDAETDSLINEENKMLDTIELLTTQFAQSAASESNEMLDDDGVRVLQESNFILVFINPLVRNVTGIELHRKVPSDDIKSFLDFTIKKLDLNHRVEDTNQETLELMVHISAKAFDQIKITTDNQLKSPNRLIFKIYFKPSLFDEHIFDDVRITPDSKVIGISIPNFPNREYPDGIVTMFKTISETTAENDTRGCSENTIKTSPTRSWNQNLWDKQLDTKGIVICPVKRPANIGFAKLVGRRIRDPYPEIDKSVEITLNYVTFVGCTLSILGLSLIFITAIFNPAWRQNEATPLVLNVSLASLFLIVMYYVVEVFGKPKYEEYCTILGSILHYAVLVGFFVSVFVTNCQYARYIVIVGDSVPKYLNIKIFIFGWVIPLLIVAFWFGLEPEAYIERDLVLQTDTNRNAIKASTINCFPTKLPLYVGLHLPIMVIFCYNLSIYVWIIRRVRQETPSLRKTPSKTTVYVQIRLFLYLFFILSITWIFALLDHYTGIVIFAMLFNVTGTMQGFCFSIFCVFIHEQTRQFWIRKLKCTTR